MVGSKNTAQNVVAGARGTLSRRQWAGGRQKIVQVRRNEFARLPVINGGPARAFA